MAAALQRSWDPAEPVSGSRPRAFQWERWQGVGRVGLHATFLYMSDTVGIAELRQNLSVYLRRVANGERLIVTDRNRPVAELGPPATSGSGLDRLIAEGRITRPTRPAFPPPLRLEGDPNALTRALDAVRGER